MKNVKFISLVFVLLLASLILSCQKNTSKNSGFTIVTTIFPYEILAKQIVGDKAEVKTLIPPNASPHTYSPLPSDIKLLENADLIISNGLEFEEGLEKILFSMGQKHLIMASVIPQAMLIHEQNDHALGDRHEGGESHQHMQGNPHLWTDYEFLIDMAREITRKMVVLQPANAQYFENNLKTIETELNHVNEVILTERKQYSQPAIILFHDSYAYFNSRYQIHTAGVIEAFPGKEPSPADLLAIHDKVKDSNVKAIFIEPQLNPKAAQILAEELKIKLLTYDPLGATLNVKTVSELLLKNWEIFKKGL